MIIKVKETDEILRGYNTWLGMLILVKYEFSMYSSGSNFTLDNRKPTWIIKKWKTDEKRKEENSN
ncbi:hypothetical protein Glove_66g12 [Diversispora epigaea]|uniref:Uncharacterized protein n=1 Tax=Diversispora epigaea TaxID=1348612 RepID=A0A397JJM8_9GLOM|nr:hypothetical protein Glove_66g12 [Diversispora epigaea]